ncbi:uncharacterized protein LOC113326293 [Papaver somniferum]|uniref:uncharacterized protein LOC113326293 n=1 Tax=Papaver somniferum TaxID=3469 RepID=UPI000E703DB1|nr:uncharacterized protein LOC113326293 [Papaver somniferum]
MFKDMIGKTVEVYIDDMVVKSKQKESHLSDLKRTFERLRQYGMKLNPAKCSFGLMSGKFLGYMMTQRGIESNPEQVRAIQEMHSPRSVKEVQRLTGRLAALSRNAEKFGWSDDCERALNEMKRYLTSPTVLTSPKTGQTIYIYLASSEFVVSAVLFVRDPDEKPVYFVSKSLTDAETRTDDSSRLTTWDTYLGAYTIDYEPRTAEKGHALASLMEDFPVDDIVVSESILDEEILHETENMSPIPLPWEKVKTSKKASKEIHVQKSIEDSTSAEYESAISGLKTALHLGARRVILTTDSRLVANQFTGAYKAKNEKLASYLEYISELAKEFEDFSIEQKPRLENRHADSLAYLSAAVESDSTRYIIVDFQEFPSIHNTVATAHRICANENEGSSSEIQQDPMNIDDMDNGQSEDWRQPYVRYLQTKELLQDKYQAGKIMKTAWRYALIEDELYKNPISMEPYLRCVTRDEGMKLLAEAHEGCCGNHSGGRSLNDAKEYTKKCVSCQMHGPLIKRPANELHPVMSAWPFSKWGLDIVGPFPAAPEGVKYMLVATDYFTKWVEAVALVKTEEVHVRRFIWENIVCSFGIPATIVSDNGKQFDSEKIKSLCEGLHIKHNFSTPYYAQSNGQAEATNKVILDNLKKTLDKAK